MIISKRLIVLFVITMIMSITASFIFVRPASATPVIRVIGNGTPQSCNGYVSGALQSAFNEDQAELQINFNCGGNYTFVLSSRIDVFGTLANNNKPRNIIIDGGSNVITFDAQGNNNLLRLTDSTEANRSTLTLRSLRFVNGKTTTSAQRGGALDIGVQDVVYLKSVEFYNNVAIPFDAGVTSFNKAKGGAIYNDGYLVSMEGSQFNNNKAAGKANGYGPTNGTAYGGAIYNSSYSNGALIENTIFTGNAATVEVSGAGYNPTLLKEGGGAIYVENGLPWIIDRISRNAVTTITGNTLFQSNQAISGGALYVNGATVNISFNRDC